MPETATAIACVSSSVALCAVIAAVLATRRASTNIPTVDTQQQQQAADPRYDALRAEFDEYVESHKNPWWLAKDIATIAVGATTIAIGLNWRGICIECGCRNLLQGWCEPDGTLMPLVPSGACIVSAGVTPLTQNIFRL